MPATSGPSRIFVKNLPTSLSLEDFRTHFSQQAPITDAKLLPQRRIGYVGYKSAQDADKAVLYFNKSFLGMARLSVEIAQPMQTLNDRPFKRRRLERSADIPVTQRDIDTKGPKRFESEIADGYVHVKINADVPTTLQVIHPSAKAKVGQNQGVEERLESPNESSVRLSSEYARKYEHKVAAYSQLSPGERSPGTGSQIPSPPQTPATKQKTGEEVINSNANVLKPLVSIGAPTSDNDWLRSRTSRLLDLVDDDEAIQDRFSEDEHTIENMDISGKTANTSIEVASGRSDGVKPEDGTDTIVDPALDFDSDHHPGVNNGRLFVRNLTYTATEHELRNHFADAGYGRLLEVCCFFEGLRIVCYFVMNILIGTSYAFAHAASRKRNRSRYFLCLKTLNASMRFSGRNLPILADVPTRYICQWTLDHIKTKGLLTSCSGIRK